jgi:hypothetical protein
VISFERKGKDVERVHDMEADGFVDIRDIIASVKTGEESGS